MIKKVYFQVLIIVLMLVMSGCNNKTFSLRIYDIGNTLICSDDKIIINDDENYLQSYLSSYSVETLDNKIITINGSVIDSNYELVIYRNSNKVNADLNLITVEENDVIEIKNECINDKFDETDIDIDKTIYSFMRIKYKEMISSYKMFYDYFLASGVINAIEMGLDSRYFNFDTKNEDVKNYLNSINWEESSEGNILKGLVTMISMNKEISNDYFTDLIRNKLVKKDFVNQWILVPCYYLNIERGDVSYLLEEVNKDSKDQELMSIITMSLYDDMPKELLDKCFENSTIYGIDSYGVNCASTALFVIACCALGINAREYAIEDVDVLKSLLSYYSGDGFIWKQGDTSNDLMFSTPQAMSALICYKIYRDNDFIGCNNIFDLR